jgi:hypothetical protein
MADRKLWAVMRDAYDESDDGTRNDWKVRHGYAAELRAIADRAEYMDPPEPPLTSPCSEYDSGFGHGALAMQQQFVAWLRAAAAEAEGES